MFIFSSRSDFEILSELLLILDLINHIHDCIRLDQLANLYSVILR